MSNDSFDALMEPQFNANVEGLEILGPLFLRPLSIRFGGEMGRGRGAAGRAIISTSSTCQKREEEERRALWLAGGESAISK